jgi:hypothetical protein
LDRRGRDGYHPAVSDARGEGVVEAAGRGIEIIPGSFSQPFASFWRRRRNGYHPAVFHARGEGVVEAAGRGIEKIPGSFGPLIWALLVGAGGTAILLRYPVWKREESRK